MIYSIGIKDDFLSSVVNIFTSQLECGLDLSEHLIITPDYYFTYYLKKKFKEGILLPRISTIKDIFKNEAIKKNKFDYVDFELQGLAKLYAILGDSYPIEQLSHILQQCYEVSTQELINQKFSYPLEYKKFQKETLEQCFAEYKSVTLAGIRISDEISEHLYNLCLKQNMAIFIQEAAEELSFVEDLTFKFCKDKPIKIIRQIDYIDTIFFKSDGAVPQYQHSIIEKENDYQQLIATLSMIDEAMNEEIIVITSNERLAIKLFSLLKKKKISAQIRQPYEEHLDADFLLGLLDVSIFNYEDINLLSLMKHPYLSEKQHLVDTLEKQFFRKIRFSELNINTETCQYLEFIKKISTRLQNAKNFASEHLKCCELITNDLSIHGKKILRYIALYFPKITDIVMYRGILSYFLKREFFKNCADYNTKKKVEISSIYEASLVEKKHIILLDFNDRDFPSDNLKITTHLLNIFNKNVVDIIFNKNKEISKILLQIKNLTPLQERYVNHDATEIKEQLHYNTVDYSTITNNKTLYIAFHYLPKILNPTSTELLLNDPYEFYLKYVLNIKEILEPGIRPSYKEFGIMMHSIMQRFKDQYVTEAQYLQYLLKEIEMYKLYPHIKNFWLARAKKMLSLLADMHNERLENVSRIETEVEYQMSFPELPEIILKCRLDRIEFLKNGNISIIDFKTGTLPSVKEITSLQKIQILLQAIIVSGVHNESNIEELIYCKPGIESLALRKIKNTELSIMECKSKLLQILSEYRSSSINFLEANK